MLYSLCGGGNLTSSESALVQEILDLVAINSQLNEAVEQAEQQQRDEQVRVQHISRNRKVCNNEIKLTGHTTTVCDQVRVMQQISEMQDEMDQYKRSNQVVAVGSSRSGWKRT